jgi:hypothetical protein
MKRGRSQFRFDLSGFFLPVSSCFHSRLSVVRQCRTCIIGAQSPLMGGENGIKSMRYMDRRDCAFGLRTVEFRCRGADR